MILAGCAAVLVYYNKSTSRGNWLEVPEKPWEESHGLACPAEWSPLRGGLASVLHPQLDCSFVHLDPGWPTGQRTGSFFGMASGVLFLQNCLRQVSGKYKGADLDEGEIAKPFSFSSSPSSLLDMEWVWNQLSFLSTSFLST